MTTAGLPRGEDERLAALAELDLLGTPPEERFDRVTRLCRRLFGVPMAFVNLVDRDRVYMKSAVGLPAGVDLARGETVCSTTIGGDEPLEVEDLRDDPRFAGLPAVVGDPNMRFYAGVPLATPGGQRVGTLCIADTAPRRLDAADRALLQDLSLWVAKELSLDDELDRAGEVQRAMLPARRLEDPAWDVAGHCRPARDVGGDFYDWHRTPAGPVVALGDVMGKGMPAAIVMAGVRAALRAGARKPDLAEAVRDAAWSLADDLEATGTFATVALCRLEADGCIVAVDAGHAHLTVVRDDGSLESFPAGGLPLGIDADETYEAHRLQLGRGDALLLHSDGLLELPGGPRSTADAARLVAGAASAGEAAERLVRLADGAALPDDVTVLVARRSA